MHALDGATRLTGLIRAASSEQKSALQTAVEEFKMNSTELVQESRFRFSRQVQAQLTFWSGTWRFFGRIGLKIWS